MKKSNPQSPTLEEIGGLLDLKLEQKLEEKLEPLKIDIHSLKTQIKEGFDQIADQLQEVIQAANELSEHHTETLRVNIEPRIKKLEQKVFAS